MRKVQTFTERSPQKRFLTLPKNKKIQSLATTKNHHQQTYKYYIGPGNNAELVRRILSTRKQWEEINDSKYLFLNFKWQQSNKNFKYQNCLDNKVFKHSLNHCQFHQELSNKENLFKNLLQYCQSQKIDIYQFVPLTFTLNLADSSFQQNQSNFLRVFQSYLPEQMKKPGRKEHLILKKRKAGNMLRTLQVKQKNISKFPIKDVFMEDQSKYLWILKPTSFNRGNGIHVCNSLQSLESLMNSYLYGDIQPGKAALSNELSSPEIKCKSFRIREYTNQQNRTVSSFVIQKYLEKPLLIDSRKFDIRVWVLFTHQMKVYLFKQGYIRTSSCKYSTNESQILDLNVHLTNNAVQKYSSQYGKYEDGNQLSFKILKNLIESEGGNYLQVINKMKWIIKLTALSVKKKINKYQRSTCFQIFGYDFMIDSKCKPWLIEVNTNPCIQESSALLQNLLPRMIDDAFCLTLDRMFQTEKKGYNYSLENQYSTDNLWQFIVDIKKPPERNFSSNQVIGQGLSQIQ